MLSLSRSLSLILGPVIQQSVRKGLERKKERQKGRKKERKKELRCQVKNKTYPPPMGIRNDFGHACPAHKMKVCEQEKTRAPIRD